MVSCIRFTAGAAAIKGSSHQLMCPSAAGQGMNYSNIFGTGSLSPQQRGVLDAHSSLRACETALFGRRAPFMPFMA